MFSRLCEWTIVTLWLVSMAWLVALDAVPRWFAQEPPPAATSSWLQQQGRKFQYGVFDHNGPHRGTYWTLYESIGDTLTRLDYLELRDVQFVGKLRLKSKMVFFDDEQLDSVEVTIMGLRAKIELLGERQGPMFAFALKIGPYPIRELKLDAQSARTLCNVTKPFSALQNLEVGQSWKIHVLDPFALIHSRKQNRFKDVVVTVTGREKIQLQGTEYECFVVESPGARAWVHDNGRVLLQEVDIPALGKVEIQEQPFNQERLDEFRNRMDGIRRPRRFRNSAR